MSNPWIESTEKPVLYPDDLPGAGLLEILSAEPIDADEVPHDEAGHGSFCRVRLAGTETEKWIACPREVRALIGEAIEANGEIPVIEIFEAERGPEDHDPWEIDGRVVTEGDPA